MVVTDTSLWQYRNTWKVHKIIPSRYLQTKFLATKIQPYFVLHFLVGQDMLLKLSTHGCLHAKKRWSIHCVDIAKEWIFNFFGPETIYLEKQIVPVSPHKMTHATHFRSPSIVHAWVLQSYATKGPSSRLQSYMYNTTLLVSVPAPHVHVPKRASGEGIFSCADSGFG